MIYLIGSLKKPRVPKIANELRALGFDIFDEWTATAPDTDRHWEMYERKRGHNFQQALKGKAAENAFSFDFNHLLQCKAAVLVAPCGKSAHLELGWILGQGKPGFILLDGEPDEFDLMYKLATGVCMSVEELVEALGARGIHGAA